MKMRGEEENGDSAKYRWRIDNFTLAEERRMDWAKERAGSPTGTLSAINNSSFVFVLISSWPLLWHVC